jgi:hypothetical protein
MSPPITQAPRGLTRSTGLLDHIQAPLPPADTTRSPVECDQEVRLNLIRIQTRLRGHDTLVFFLTSEKTAMKKKIDYTFVTENKTGENRKL